jgi:hypothetical protein
MKKIFTAVFICSFLNASTQNNLSANSFPRYKIWLYTNKGNILKGILILTSDSSVKIFRGTYCEWHSHSSNSIDESYLNIASIKTHKRGGLIKGMLVGLGIGLTPLLVGSAFGQAEGGAYLSIATLPVGLITGAIIGATSKKKFLINGDASKFQSFRKRMN